MRTFFVFLFLPYYFAQAQFIDDFSDEDFNSNPEWVGSTALFRIDPQRGALQLYAPAEAGQAWLFTQSNAIEDAVWQFSFRMGFNPSSTNYAQVYLAADMPDILQINASYYLVLGTTADNVSLWQRTGGVNRRLIEGEARRLDFNIVEGKVRVTRNKGGLFILETDMGAGWVEEGRYEGSPGFAPGWFGLSCHYTATRSTLFWFDDFVVTGEAYRDTIPPHITSFEVLNRYGFRLQFSKPLEMLTIKPDNFTLAGSDELPDLFPVESNAYALDVRYMSGIPTDSDGKLTSAGISDVDGNRMSDSAFIFHYIPAKVSSFKMLNLQTAEICFTHEIRTGTLNQSSFLWHDLQQEIQEIEITANKCFTIRFSENIPNGETISVRLASVVAVNGDTISSGPYHLYFYLTRRNDLVITEVMHNPSPPVLLPDSEYLEVFNRSAFPINLHGFRLTVGTRNATLGSYLLFPGDYLLLVPSTQINEWAFVENSLGVASWPLLPNAGGDIVLRDQFDRVITSLRYSANMGEQGFKQDGGWSLEVKDYDNLSGDWDNWAFSTDSRGGTPGAASSIARPFPDVIAPVLEDVHLLNDSCLVLEFSEPMMPDEKIDVSNVTINPGTLMLSGIYPEEPFLITAKACFASSIPENSHYLLSFNQMPEDLAGNRLFSPGAVRFANPVKADLFDVVINELLFDPPSGGEDFVELHNRSDKIIDLSQLYLARNNSDGVPEKLVQLSSVRRSMFPGDFTAFTPARNWLLTYYAATAPETVRQLPELPNYVNAGGTVFLTDVSGSVLERFDYSEKMHFPLLSSTKGVSLERIDANAPAANVFNWHSASAESGYATPGRKNSQSVSGDNQAADDWIVLEPEVFTPNQDGLDDLLFIRYRFESPGNSCSVIIFNRGGQPVRQLVNNRMVGTEGFFSWDGTDDKGLRCPTGIYIVLVRCFDLKGVVREDKKVTVLGSGR